MSMTNHHAADSVQLTIVCSICCLYYFFIHATLLAMLSNVNMALEQPRSLPYLECRLIILA